MASNEYVRKKNRLKKQWSYIDAALKIVRLTQQSEKQKYLLEAIMKSDFPTFDKLLNDNLPLVNCPIPIGYNHFNIYQIIIERSSNSFIEHVFNKYFDSIDSSTENGKILVPVGCERGDASILKLILKYFPQASLNDTSHSNSLHTYLLHHEPRQLIQRELDAYENEIPLLSIIRNDRPDLLSILFQFQSFSIDHLTQQQLYQVFNLCLLAEHRHVSIDKYNIKWLKNQSLRPCGSIECFRLLIEHTHFNPLKICYNNSSSTSPFTFILEPVYHNAIKLHNQLLLDLQTKFHVHLLQAMYELINKQMQLFTYLITHCCYEPNKADVFRFNECNHYIDEIFHQTNEYSSVKRIMSNVQCLLSKINKQSHEQCLSLKEICRFVLRDYVRNKQYVLVHVEHMFIDLSSSHRLYLKYLS